MARLILVLAFGVLALVGCGSSEPEVSQTEQQSAQQAQTAASNWSPEQIEAFKKAKADPINAK